jgi:hypothetical protein
MALKDWKRVGNGKNYTVWSNKKEDIVLNIGFAEKKYSIFIRGYTNTFKTKTQALQFAKQYMRSH